MRPIATDADIAAGLAALLKHDPRLRPLAERAGPLPLRLRAGGFEGLAAIITAQQISDAAAASIWARLHAAVQPFDAGTFLLASDEALRAAGLSRGKVRTLRALSAASAEGFDLGALQALPAEDAIMRLTAFPGIGPWTAEVYLLFCTGHPDIFPAGDLALQIGVQQGFGLADRPDTKVLREMATTWSPWRGVAARLFWAYYRVQRDAARLAKP